MADLEDSLHRLNKIIEELRLDIKDRQTEFEELGSELYHARQDIDRLGAEIDDLQDQIYAYEHKAWLEQLDAMAAGR